MRHARLREGRIIWRMRFPRSLSALLAIFFVAGAIYSVSTPILEASDELWHMAVVEHLSQGRGLPIQDPNQHGFYEQEGSQPPLYYLFLAGFAGAFDLSDFRDRAQFNPHGKLGRADTRTNWNITLHSAAEDFPWRRTTLFVHVARLLGVLMGMVTVWAVWGISTELGAALAAAGIRLPGLPLAATALVALNPMFVFISASVNNDTLAVLLSSLSLLIGMRALTTGLTSRSALALGIFLGGAALTKSSGLALCVVVPGALAVSALVKGARTGACPRRLGPALMSGLVAAAIAGWFYVRNQLLYGDFTGTQMMALIAGQRERLPTASELLGEFEGFSQSYIGLFGAVNIPIAGAIYALFNALLVFAGLGLLSLASAWRKSWRGWVGMLNAPTTLPAGMLAAVFLVAALALVRWTSLTSASQGRLLFPAIGAISSLVTAARLTASAAVARAGRSG